MRIALPFFLLLMIGAIIMIFHEPLPHIDDSPDLSLPVYAACAKDADCTLVARPCAAPIAARKDRRQELEYYFSRSRRPSDPCPDIEKRPLRAMCHAQRCRAQEG